MNEINKDEFTINMLQSIKCLMNLWGSWIRTDYGTIDDCGSKSHLGTKSEIIHKILDVPKYEVFRELENNNFIVCQYPAGDGPGAGGECNGFFYGYTKLMYNLDRKAYNYLFNALNANKSTIVYLYQDGDKPNVCYDIYYDAWDIGDNPDVETVSSYNGYDDFEYLQSRMKAKGLSECKYDYRDIRKEKVYPSMFQSKNMTEEERKIWYVDKRIKRLIRKCNERLFRMAHITDAVDLYKICKFSFSKIYDNTNIKGWQILRFSDNKSFKDYSL